MAAGGRFEDQDAAAIADVAAFRRRRCYYRVTSLRLNTQNARIAFVTAAVGGRKNAGVVAVAS